MLNGVNSELFRWLVQHHRNSNLPRWLNCSKLDNGRLVPLAGETPIEGFGENKETRGFLVLANGSALADNLIKDKIVKDKIIPPWDYISSREDFHKYVRDEKRTDSAYVIDTKKGRITRIREFNNDIELPDGSNFSDWVPRDFLSADGFVAPEEMGLKSRNAIRIALFYKDHSVETYQVKATPYGNMGIGKITHFDEQGLKEEYFFRLEGNEISEIYRNYRGLSDKPNRNRNGELYPSLERRNYLGSLEGFKLKGLESAVVH